MDAASAKRIIGQETKFYECQILLDSFLTYGYTLNAAFVLYYYGEVPRMWKHGETREHKKQYYMA